MTPDQALAIAAEKETIGKRTQLLSTGEALVTLAAEVRRLRSEAEALRLTLGQQPTPMECPEPIGCPIPGACATVMEISRLRGIVATLCDDVEACLGLEFPHRDQYPSQMRKFESEMELIREYRRSIGAGQEKKP